MSRIFDRCLVILGLLTALILSGGGQATEATGLQSEMPGTHKVLKVIRNVSLPRTDQQVFQDIVDIKGQLYSQSSLLTPTAAVSGPPPSRPNAARGVSQRYRTPYRR